MKKITIDKNDEIAEVIDRILAVADSDVTLVIPKNSLLAKSASNFRLLKREAGLAEKLVTVESSDENVTAFAQANGLATAGAGHHNTVHLRPVNGVSDIVPKRPSDDEEDEEEPAARRKKSGPAVKLSVQAEEEVEEKNEEEEEQEEEGERSFFGGRDRFFKPREVSASKYRDGDDDESSGGGISGKAVAWIAGVIVVLIVAFYIVTSVFGRAQVTIDFTQTPWTYQVNAVAATSAATTTQGTSATASAGVLTIPAQVFTTQKNITQPFLATGASAGVSTKAQGTITIYNDYNAEPQDLVATTRFLTPDGKIFRLVNNTTVPGAQVSSSGTIIASSINAPIVADQGGPAYNVGPVAKLTIPGFQKTPAKYAGFYGAITGQTTGGFTGSKPIPTAADITNAKAKTTAILQGDLQDGLTASYPGSFKILDGATNIAITKMIVSTSTDASGNFSVFAEASLTAIGFDKAALQNYLLSVAQTQAPGGGATPMAFKNFAEPTYTNVQANFSKGQLSFSIAAQETIEPAFSADDFATSVAGKSIGDARNTIQALPQLSDGTISVWPIWLWDMPSNPQKIQVTVN